QDNSPGQEMLRLQERILAQHCRVLSSGIPWES
ncbi:rRNA maturation RNase YbeY, partial [Treponema pallidum]